MSLLKVENLSHNFGDIDIFKNISFSVEKNSRIGLIGKNGSGKSTLFNIISGNILPHKGKLSYTKKIKISYLTQEPNLPEAMKLYDFVVQSRPDYLELEAKLRQAEHNLSEDSSEKNMQNLAKLQQQFEIIDGYNYTTQIKLVLTNLKFPQSVWKKPIANFSGGGKTRIQLAKILLEPFNLLLLDEPTNHLDLAMIFWLENYLRKIEQPYIIISHDRYFLDNTITKIFELENCRLHQYNCNYTNYKTAKKNNIELQSKQYERQQKFIKKTQDFIQKNMAGQKVNQAKSRQKMLAKMDVIEKPEVEKKIKLNINSKSRSGNDVCKFHQVAIGYPDNILAQNINLELFYQDKIAVVGPNGCGKTTLLKIINQELKPLSGKIKLGTGLQIGFYDQMHLSLNDSLTVKETIWQLAPTADQGYVLGYLAKFGFRGDNVEKPVSVLSGGEKARLYLAKLLHEHPNFLILDEPTNHLDLDMIDSLETALQDYEGTVLFVSHDRYFIEKVASKKWSFENGTIRETSANLEDIFAQIGRAQTFQNAKRNSADKPKKSTKTNPIILKKKLQEIENKNSDLEKLEEELISLQSEFYDPNIYNRPQKLKKINSEIKNIKDNINRLREEIDILEEDYLQKV
jgi:ATP-binding cassette subfamily F protein 3